MTSDSGVQPEGGLGSTGYEPGSTESADQTKQRTLAQAKERLQELREKAGPLAEQAKGKAGELAEKAGPVAAQAKEKASGAAGKASDLAATGVTAAAEGLDKVTGGRWHDKITGMSEKLSHALERDHSIQTDDGSSAATSGPTSLVESDDGTTSSPTGAPSSPSSLLDAGDALTPEEPPVISTDEPLTSSIGDSTRGSAISESTPITPTDSTPEPPPSGPTPLAP